jgi:YggT family protein
MDVIFVPLLQVITTLISMYVWAVIIHVILSWLMNFNVVNPGNQFIALVNNALHNIVDPALNYLRRYVPSFGSLDLSPLALIFGLYFIQMVLARLVMKIVG